MCVCVYVCVCPMVNNSIFKAAFYGTIRTYEIICIILVCLQSAFAPSHVLPSGGSAWIAGLINSFVHCIMYSYYLLAGLGPAVRRHLWWKRYLTQLQLTQFAVIVLFAWIVQVSIRPYMHNARYLAFEAAIPGSVLTAEMRQASGSHSMEMLKKH